LNIEVNNKTGDGATEDEIKNTAEKAFEYLLTKKIINAKEVSLSIALVDEDEIRKLNKRYRGEDKPTDVLSYGYENKKNRISGEVIICPSIIEKYAEADGMNFEKELQKNVIHGILHIIGFEHSEKMFTIQEGILKRLK